MSSRDCYYANRSLLMTKLNPCVFQWLIILMFDCLFSFFCRNIPRPLTGPVTWNIYSSHSPAPGLLWSFLEDMDWGTTSATLANQRPLLIKPFYYRLWWKCRVLFVWTLWGDRILSDHRWTLSGHSEFMSIFIPPKKQIKCFLFKLQFIVCLPYSSCMINHWAKSLKIPN